MPEIQLFIKAIHVAEKSSLGRYSLHINGYMVSCIVITDWTLELITVGSDVFKPIVITGKLFFLSVMNVDFKGVAMVNPFASMLVDVML
jgi:hypothetical protein